MSGRRFLWAPACAVALVLAACGGDDAGEGDGTDENGQVTLTVWASREQYIPPDQFAAFMEENPDIVIEWDVQDNDDILQQLQRMRQAGQDMPDVIQDDSFLIGAYKDLDLIVPIDEQIQRWEDEDPDTYDNMLPIVFDEATLDGEIFGMAPTSDFDVFFYNIGFFEDAGVEIPFESWDDVLAGLEAVKAASPDVIPLTVQALAGEGVTAMRGFMGDVGVPFEGATPELTSPEGIYVIDWYQRAQEAGLLPPDAIAWGQSEARGAFIGGGAALITEGLNSAPDFLEAPGFTYDEDWSMTAKPTSMSGDQDDGTPLSSARTWAVTAGSEHPYEASLVMRYLASTENLVNTIEQRVIMPRNLEALDSPELADYLPFLTPELKEAFVEAEPAPAAPNAGEVEGVLEQLFGEIVQGTDESAEDLAARYQEQLDAL